MKRFTSVMMAAALLSITLTGCKSEPKPTTATSEPVVEPSLTPTIDSTTTESKTDFRQLPVFELSDDLASRTFSLDGKVFKLLETSLQDLVQCGFELDMDKTAVAKANRNTFVNMQVPGDEVNSEIYFSVKPSEEMNMMDEKLVITSVGFKTDDLTKTKIPSTVICGIDMAKDFTTLEDYQAKLGSGEIADIGSGDRSLSLKVEPEDCFYVTLTVEHFNKTTPSIAVSMTAK